MKLELFRPISSEETLGLLAETRAAVLLDSRVVDAALEVRRLAQDVDSSLTEIALRAWRDTLPDRHSEWLEARSRLGWTREEIREIASLLAAANNMLITFSEAGVLGAETCRRDASRLRSLYNQWLDLIGEAEAEEAEEQATERSRALPTWAP